MWKRLKNIAGSLVILVLIWLVIYLGWSGWYKLVTPEKKRGDGVPMRNAAIHMASVIVLFFASFALPQPAYEQFMFGFFSLVLCSIVFLITGFIIETLFY